MQHKLPITISAVALGLCLTATVCGSSKSSSAVTTKVAAAAAATAAPADAMMAADKPFGAACSSVPASGAGSFDGMSKDPAATAASNNPLLSTLVTAVKAAGLVDTLNSTGPFTIFAPYNDAFGKIDKVTLDKLLADPKGDLTKILTYHVVAGQKMDVESLVKAGMVKTVNGGSLTVTKSGGNYMVNGAKILCGNVPTANATVFIIDSVLMPS